MSSKSDESDIYKVSLLLFNWHGYSSSGEKIAGQSIAGSEIELHSQLKEKHIQIIDTKCRSLSTFERWKNKVNRKDIILITHQLATMLDSGIPILSALKLLMVNQVKMGSEILIFRIIKQLESGFSLSNCFRHKHPLFDDFFCNLVLTGEQTGKLSEVFLRITAYQEKSYSLRRKTIKAMLYPCIIFSVAFILIVLMMTLVIPEFEQMFLGFNAELPWLTRKIISFSEWINKYLWLILITPCLIIWGIKYQIKCSPKFQLKLSRMMLKIPLFGNIIAKASLAKFSRTLSMGISSGIHISQALLTSAHTADNIHYQLAFEQVNYKVSSGSSIYIAMRNTNVFPEIILQMIMIGETSGRLDDILSKVALIYESEVDNIIDNLGQLLEPVILIILGSIVGLLVVALYLPIFNLVSVF